jgi:hypothetical protein
MSELKEYLCVEALVPEIKEIPGYLMHMAKYRAPQAEMELVYLKSEADKVIAELQKQVHDYAQGLYVIQARADKDARHQKYKRCLAMAKWCDEVMMSCELRGYAVHRIWANRHQWAMRWKYRWLELAEKFKLPERKFKGA